ncbi:MAG: Gldg family protein, partial [Gammaproteobacteria bacterium]
MTTKEKRSLGGSALVILAVLFLALTVLSNVLFKGVRLDLTEHKLYTISEGTENILADIEEPVNLYYFFSDRATENIPYLRTYAKRVRELLQEIALKSGGKIRLTELDPLPFSEEEDRAAQYGLQSISLAAGGDPIYFGIAGTNAVDDLEVITFFQPDREPFLEYDVAKLIYTLAHPDRPVVALLSTLPMTAGFDPVTRQARQPWVIATQIEQLFELRQLDAASARIDEDVD